MTESLCQRCAGLCCRYTALPIETPQTKDDYDDIRWYLAHEGISVFVEQGDWYINIAARCKFLDRDNRCAIYERRPKICRRYADENCDFHSGDYGYELHFTSLEEFDDYLESIGKLKDYDKPRKKSAKAKRSK